MMAVMMLMLREKLWQRFKWLFYLFIYLFIASFFFLLVPVFGAELGFQFRPAERPAPIVVMKCIQALDKGGLQTLGIHSIIPTGSEKNALRTALNQSNNH